MLLVALETTDGNNLGIYERTKLGALITPKVCLDGAKDTKREGSSLRVKTQIWWCTYALLKNKLYG